MKIIHSLRDKFRTLAGIRIERQLDPVSELPIAGSNIVREKLRIRLKYPVSEELWKWLSAMGWRVIDMRSNRRRYIVVPDKVLMKLIKANMIERAEIHTRLIGAVKHEKRLMRNTITRLSTKSSTRKSSLGFANTH
jgi:hypothetical protein